MQNDKKFIIVLLFITTLAQICTDLYTPSLPAISYYFKTSTGTAQMTLTLCMLGTALTCLIYGPLSEVIGRRYTLIAGIVISIIGCLLCVSAKHIIQLQMGRFIQGCGLGACTSLWRSIVRDVYSGQKLAQLAAYLTNFFVLSVILAPFLGGYLEVYFGWRAAFIFLFFWSITVLCLVIFAFTETNQHHGRHRLTIQFILSTYIELLTSKKFMSYTFCALLTYGGLFTWIAGGPIVLIHRAHLSPILFGWLSIFVGAMIMLGSITNAKLIPHFGTKKLLYGGWLLMICSGLLMLIGNAIWGASIFTTLTPALLFIFSTAWVFANLFAEAFKDVGHIAGYAGALYSSIQLLGGSIFTGILAHLNTSNPDAIACLFIASGALSLIIYQICVPKQMVV